MRYFLSVPADAPVPADGVGVAVLRAPEADGWVGQQVLERDGSWAPGDRLARYFVLGSDTDDDIEVVAPDVLRERLTAWVAAGRFARVPDLD